MNALVLPPRAPAPPIDDALLTKLLTEPDDENVRLWLGCWLAAGTRLRGRMRHRLLPS